ncbi:MAG: S41 family peptidase, partial [Bacteroidota bacterium]
GIRYYVVNDTATITYIDPTGPSGAAGLRKGDKILSINGINTVGQNFQAIDTLIIADRGTELAFQIRRKNPLTIKSISVTSISLFAASVDAAYVLTENIGYLKLNRFTMKTLGECQEALKDMVAQGVENLVIDLRGNRGGVVKGATNLADEFLSEGQTIMTSKGKGLPESAITSTAGGLFEKGKVVILTDAVTASASEIFTGAMQEWDRALVMGSMTYGKGLIQQSYMLEDGAAVRLTIGRYYTPTGRILQRPFQFDSTKDWIYQNIANSVHHNGFTRRLVHPKSVAWQTKSGRKILKGQGGIIPDIYLPTLAKSTPQLTQLNNTGIVYRFVGYHVDAYRNYYLNKFKTGNDFRKDTTIDKDLTANFKAFLAANLSDEALIQSVFSEGVSPHVLTQIKAWMGPQIWTPASYFMVFNEEDEAVQRAIDAIRSDVFKAVGITY